MPLDFSDLDSLIDEIRMRNGIQKGKLNYEWRLSAEKTKKLSPYLNGIDIKQNGSEMMTVSLFRNFSQALHETVDTGTIEDTVRVIRDILFWGGINWNKDKKLQSYARQLHIVGKITDDEELLNTAMEELYYSRQAGVASWSKILAAWDTKAFFIYDANVAAALQTIYKGQYLFWLPDSKSAEVINYYAEFNGLEGKKVDYREYCEALRKTGDGNHLEKTLFMLGHRLTRRD